MYYLSVKVSFDAAHRLPDYNGPCRRLHGHRWDVIATWCFEDLITGAPHFKGMAADLSILKNYLRKVIALFDHTLLNDSMSVAVPTAELIAKDVFERLCREADPISKEHLYSIRVFETPDSFVTYIPKEVENANT